MESKSPNDPRLNVPDADTVYRNYLESCRRRGVDPVPRQRAHELVAEWTAAIGPAMAREYSRRAH